MYHNFVLVQKIQEKAKLNVYFAQNQFINWTYETSRSPNAKTNTPIFPIVITDQDIKIIEKPVGRETSCIRITPTKIRFSDDYSVPEGFLICITGPEGYMPSVVKFKHKPLINRADYNQNIPAYFEVLTNKSTKQASIIMHTFERSYFGISVDFDKSESDFASNRRPNYHDPFDVTVSLINGNIERITSSQVSAVIPELDIKQAEKLTDTLNELVDFLRNSNQSGDFVSVPTNLKNKVSQAMINLIATCSSVVTLADSYSNNGFASEFIKLLVNFFK